MKVVRENINEAVKHLTGKSEEEVMEGFFSDGELLFDEFVPFIQKIEYELRKSGLSLYQLGGYPIEDNGEGELDVQFNDAIKDKFIKKIKETFDAAIEYCY